MTDLTPPIRNTSPRSTQARPDPRLILATDLDGTFLAGDAEQRHRLYRLSTSTPRSA